MQGNLLRDDINKLVGKLGFKGNIRVLKVSKDTDQANAHVSGILCNYTIVLTDTMLKQMLGIKEKERSETKLEEEEKPELDQSDFDYDNEAGCHQLLALIAHELGHWKRKDNFKKLIIMLVTFCLRLFLFELTFF